jgi:mRNA interferase RelE/StbE
LAYRVEFRPAAARDLKKLDREVVRRIVARTEALGVMSRPPGAKKVEGHDRRYRLRVGEYRVVYEVEDAVLLVLVVRVGHRREIYRLL